ncbi:MAG: hypothetical protein ABEJ89_00710 [Haloarculaceae archaeon]
MSFPYHTVPDGSVALSHHFTWGLLLALVPILVVWDVHPNRQPAGVLTSIIVAFIGFILMWPVYHVAGALVTLAGLAAASVATVFRLLQVRFDDDLRWSYWPVIVWALLLLVAWDDAIQHAFGVVTPLDWTWKHGLRHVVIGL